MKSLSLHLPNYVYDRVEEQANIIGVDASTLCSNVLADVFLPREADQSETEIVRPEKSSRQPQRGTPASFDVARNFPGFPQNSIALAQQFCDAALKLGPPRGYAAVYAEKSRRGIYIRPNFAVVEYLISRGKSGISVSFYGEPHRHTNPPKILVKGRHSYSRARIHHAEDLEKVLPHIKQAYELKFGSLA
jgi:hypothetical protein